MPDDKKIYTFNYAQLVGLLLAAGGATSRGLMSYDEGEATVKKVVADLDDPGSILNTLLNSMKD